MYIYIYIHRLTRTLCQGARTWRTGQAKTVPTNFWTSAARGAEPVPMNSTRPPSACAQGESVTLRASLIV